MDALPECCPAGPASPARYNPDAAPPAPRAVLAFDAPAACSDISDNQLLAITDTASLTADQLDRRHHLLRHSLPDEARGESVLVHFEASSVHEAVKMVKKMSQRDLQAKFRLVYGAKTFSNNNNWLRRKLFEAIGVDPAKGAVKKAAAGGGRRRRGAAAPRAPRAPVRSAKPRAAAARGGWGGYSAADEWELYPGTSGHGYSQPYAQQYNDSAIQPAVDYEMPVDVDDDEDHSHVAEALLALGESAASGEDGSSEGSVPSSGSAAEGEEPTPASATPADEPPSAVLKMEAAEAAAGAIGGGSAAFRRLLLEQHEAAQAAHAAAAAGVAEWIAAVQQQAAAAGGAEEAALLAARMRAAAAAHLQHPILAGVAPLAPPAAPWGAAGYGLPLMPHPPAVLGALRHFLGVAQQQQQPAAPPALFAAVQ
ncbi:hypothetical protein ABPG77_006903 [Micractinium sp. CCAP 211/92]